MIGLAAVGMAVAGLTSGLVAANQVGPYKGEVRTSAAQNLMKSPNRDLGEKICQPERT